jgi:hypothetical protein
MATDDSPITGRTACWFVAPESLNRLAARRFNLYACHREIGQVLRYPRLDDQSIGYPHGRERVPFGQAGWDVGVTIKSLGDLADQLEGGIKPYPNSWFEEWVWNNQAPIGPGEIRRLAISAHGAARGIWFPNGRDRVDFKFFHPISPEGGDLPAFPDGLLIPTKSVQEIKSELDAIGKYVHPIGTIILMGCASGRGEDGTRLLRNLSEVWKHRTIVGFSTLGVAKGVIMSGHGDDRASTYAGMKLTDYFDGDALQTDYDKVTAVDAYSHLEWASETARFAKVVLDEDVLKCPEGECAPTQDAGVSRSRASKGQTPKRERR